MQYTVLGRTNLKVSRLGFGCMRLPTKSDTEVDHDLAISMLRRAYELGVNLFDTAVPYCGGESQRVLGEAFEGMRDKVVLSTKNHHYDKTDKARWWKHLEDSLELLRTDHIDIYNHHGINHDVFLQSLAGDGGIYEEMLKAREQGLIRHIGFSFHAPNDQLVKLVDTGLYDTVILQYNLLDRELEDGIAHAAASGMGVIVMGPVGGGRLGYPSDKAASLIGEFKSTPELALRFVLSNRNVHAALSGMSTMRQLEENAETVSQAGELAQKDSEQINAAIEERKKLAGLYCTGCNYCMPCPAGVDIPANFEVLNLERVFGLTEHARERYADLVGKAALCRLCGKCLEPCPQNIDIPERLGEAVKALDERAGNVLGWGELRGGSLQKGTLRLKLRYMLKNFSEQPQKARVEFYPHGEDQVRPQRFDVKQMEPYARKHKDVEISLPHPAEAYNVDAVVKHDGAELVEHICDTVVAARHVEDYSLDARDRRSGTIHVPFALHPVRVSKQPLKGHSFDFSVAYDEENLYVFADVEDDLAGAARTEDQRDARADHLRIYLDGRTPYMIGRGRYEKGVVRLTLTPPAEGGGELRVDASDDVAARAVWKRTASGYRLDCAIPWSEFLQVPAPPGVIGFDVAIRSHDTEGKETLFLNWTGRPRGERTTSAFGKLVTV